MHPFDAAREDAPTFLRRVAAQKSKCGQPFEPGDVQKINGVLGPPPKEPAEKKEAPPKEEE